MATRSRKIHSSLAGIATEAIPESPMLRRQAPAEAPSSLTINGRPIPVELAHAIPYENTDQGIAEREARPHAFAKVIGDPLDKKILERRDGLLEAMEPWEAPDPLKELADAYVPPGMRPHFLSPAKVQRDGMRGWEPVIGKSGDPVKLGNLVLAQMPEPKARARNKFYQDKDKANIAEAQDKFYEEQERFAVESGMGSRAARRSDPDNAGLRETRGNAEILR